MTINEQARGKASTTRISSCTISTQSHALLRVTQRGKTTVTLFGTTRSGKSTSVRNMLLQALEQDVPVKVPTSSNSHQ